MSSEIDALRRILGGRPVDAEDVPDHGGSDTLAVVLCSYFATHWRRPDDDPLTDNGWGEWVELQTDRVLRELAEAATARRLEYDGISLGEAANKLCRDLPEGCEVMLTMENGSAYVELFTRYKEIPLPDAAEKTLWEQLQDALAAASPAADEGRPVRPHRSGGGQVLPPLSPPDNNK